MKYLCSAKPLTPAAIRGGSTKAKTTLAMLSLPFAMFSRARAATVIVCAAGTCARNLNTARSPRAFKFKNDGKLCGASKTNGSSLPAATNAPMSRGKLPAAAPVDKVKVFANGGDNAKPNITDTVNLAVNGGVLS